MWIEDRILNMDHDEFMSLPLEELVACMPGMEYHVTCQDTHCLRVHYSADPQKSPETRKGRMWVKQEQRRIKNEMRWRREYEIDYESYDGKPVIENFRDDLHIKDYEFDGRLGLRGSVDFGTDQGVVLLGQYVQIPQWDCYQLRFLDEVVLYDSDTIALADWTVNLIKGRYEEAWENGDLRFWPDPAGNQRRETTADKDRNTSIKIFQSKGLKIPSSRKLGLVDSTDFVRALFSTMLPNGEPAVVVHSRCQKLISSLRGGWHYPKDPTPEHRGKPEKDGEHDHRGDCVRHLVCNMFPANFAGDQQKVSRPQYRYRKYTGEIIGSRRSQNLRPGEHAY